ncbi:MAG: hypothetical protein K9N49_01705 [Candidatus Marinimicrobia bacterium]|nr:hypothetical protein [Candidatus Neomarinimicrobiota bacterium]
MKMPSWVVGIIAIFLAGTSTVWGQWSTQALQFDKGWNAIYLEVEPADARCDTVFADWPVAHVSLYNMERAAARFVFHPDEALDLAAEFLTWIPGLPPGANALNFVLGGHAYLVFATQPFQRTLTGRPVVPRLEWLPGTNTCNLLGFRHAAGATFGTYLAGAGFDMSKLNASRVGGTNSVAPDPFTLGGFTETLGTTLMEPGQAYFISCDKRSSFTGPVRVFPAGSGGIVFPPENSRQTLRMVNESAAALTVTLAVTNSAPAPSGPAPVFPALLHFDNLAGWLPLTTEVQKTLQAAEEWTIPLALDRTAMVEGQTYGGVLICSDTAGGRVEIALEAQYSLPDPTRALWPAGLWVGKASLDRVSQVVGRDTVVSGGKAGEVMEIRLILHVDTSGNCRLLQRVLAAGTEDAEGNWRPALYVDEKDVPAGTKSTRISSVAFGTKNDIAWDAAYGQFGDRLRFTYVIAADDPVNPFRHPYHPDHDGLAWDFETPLPFGDDPDNYIGVTKPELFSISNTVSLTWTPTDEPGSGSALWNPSEQVAGAAEFLVEGLRREGPIVMQGRFELRRVSQVGSLATE